MSFAAPPRPARPARPPGRRSPLVSTLVILGALVLLLSLVAGIWTDVLWYDQLGFRGVYTAKITWQVGLFVLGGGLMAAAVASSLLIGYRSRPVYAPVDDEQASLDRYRESLEPLRRLVLVALPGGLALFAGSAMAQQWQTVLLFLNRQPFGEQDAQFGLDVGFYVFTLPFLRMLTGFLVAVLVLALLAAVATHYLYGGVRLQSRGGSRTTVAARRHVSVLAVLLLLVQAGSYWLDRYALLSTDGELITGASYTGVNAVIPAKTILTMIAITVALLFLVPLFSRGGWRIPLYGLVLMIVAAVGLSAIYPALVQFITVRPSQQTSESPYIERNIAATRAAYGLESVEEQRYEPTSEGGEVGGLAQDAQTAASIRLLDPAVVSPTYRQYQGRFSFYDFPDSLDVDRYEIDGDVRDVVVAVRELDLGGLQPQQRNWVNDHTVYTHGYGVVAAYGNERAANGEPAFFQGGIPSTGPLGDFEQRIYFGERSTQFSIVGGPEGSEARELDYPTDQEEGASRQETTFAGDGGPRMGDGFTRLLYAIKFRDQNILLSDAVNADSQILYDRTPRERIEKVAPFLTLDGDPYPAVVGGRVKWIVDGYTTTDAYPYSDLQPLEDATTDRLTQTSSAVVVAQGEVNYIRNSVKATVDAYDGSVDLYAWDEEDPILKAWRSAFPGAVQPMSEIDGELMSHLRYPEDLFKVQREVLGRYHVTDPSEFFSGQDRWQVAMEPTERTTQENDATAVKQPPYYLTLQMPGQESASFSLTSSYMPQSTSQIGTSVLTGFLAVDADAGSQSGERADGYGQLRLLQMPRNNTTPGPGQVQADFNSEPNVQIDLNRLREGNSDVVLGNLLTLPVADGLLYVQPVYVRSTEGTSIPLLRKVLVAFGDDIGYGDTLQEALDQVFGGDSGADTGDAGTPPVDGEPPADGEPGTPPDDGAGTPPADAQQRLDEALQAAGQALTESREALAANDFAAYGEAQDRLAAAIEAATAAQDEIAGTATTP